MCSRYLDKGCKPRFSNYQEYKHHRPVIDPFFEDEDKQGKPGPPGPQGPRGRDGNQGPPGTIPDSWGKDLATVMEKVLELQSAILDLKVFMDKKFDEMDKRMSIFECAPPIDGGVEFKKMLQEECESGIIKSETPNSIADTKKEVTEVIETNLNM